MASCAPLSAFCRCAKTNVCTGDIPRAAKAPCTWPGRPVHRRDAERKWKGGGAGRVLLNWLRNPISVGEAASGRARMGRDERCRSAAVYAAGEEEVPQQPTADDGTRASTTWVYNHCRCHRSIRLLACSREKEWVREQSMTSRRHQTPRSDTLLSGRRRTVQGRTFLRLSEVNDEKETLEKIQKRIDIKSFIEAKIYEKTCNLPVNEETFRSEESVYRFS